ncbi:MAG TPA: prolipoprotein diacylglyceryl transferase [Candidatus Limnocylindrales bacterium]|nr:prolipoprotein diacylglyceryl transferase [Candidatus Limnocylindrales bacterium]
MFDIPPDPVAFQLGPLTIGWYGLCYAIGLAVAYVLLVRLARLAGEDPDVVGNGIIIVAVAALIGGRLYHVIDQWQLYANDPVKIVLPPYSGLGVYGGIATGTLAAWWYARRRRVPFARWADIIAPALFVMQAIGRWGNYFNQELYGPPTNLPWGIPIDCAHRLQDVYSCASFPEATTRFHPLFLYESISGIIGAVFLIWLGFRFRDRLRPGDLFLVFLVWYGVTRFVLENLREDNWTFFGIPVAQIVSLTVILIGVVGLFVRHRDRHRSDRPATNPQGATWGALGAAWMMRPIDEPWANLPPPGSDIDDDDDEIDDIDDIDDDDIDEDVDDGDTREPTDGPPPQPADPTG